MARSDVVSVIPSLKADAPNAFCPRHSRGSGPPGPMAQCVGRNVTSQGVIHTNSETAWAGEDMACGPNIMSRTTSHLRNIVAPLTYTLAGSRYQLISKLAASALLAHIH